MNVSNSFSLVAVDKISNAMVMGVKTRMYGNRPSNSWITFSSDGIQLYMVEVSSVIQYISMSLWDSLKGIEFDLDTILKNHKKKVFQMYVDRNCTKAKLIVSSVSIF